MTVVWIILPLVAGFGLNLLVTPAIRRLSFKLGRVSLPREDRWHHSPTPTLGGVGIFFAFCLGLLVSKLVYKDIDLSRWTFLSGSVLLFLVGVFDEFRPMTPIAKLISQILAATLVIGLGYTSTFFTPRVSNEVLAQLPNILFTYIWLIGITNAINLLDNMDGLAGGLSIITAGVLGYFFYNGGSDSLLLVSLALVGSLLGFLVYNFPPAKIFMGDSGSLFLGFTLAALAIAQQQQASNVFAVIGVPTLIFMLPILDTTLVTITRLMRGQSPVQGGRDHTSHRLVAFGLSERQALYVLYGVAFFSATMAAALESLNYWLSLVLAPILILVLALLAAYLGRLKVVAAPAASRQRAIIARWMNDLTYRRRLFEVILDFFLIGIVLYLAFLAAFDLRMDSLKLEMVLDSLPLAYASTYLALVIFGIYKVVWRYVGFDDLVRNFQAAAGGVVIFAALIFMINSLKFVQWIEEFPGVILIYYGIFLFIALSLSRSSFRILDTIMQRYVRADEQAVLIIGAGDAGEMALRWMLMNPEMRYRPVGFIDHDPLLIGRRIHGIKVLGTLEQLSGILDTREIRGLIVSEQDLFTEWGTDLIQICSRNNCWVRMLHLDFEPMVY